MELAATVSTDTATLVVFDPARLEAHLLDESDWWTGSGDLEREEALENLLFISTGDDGLWDVVLTDQPVPADLAPLKIARLAVPTGKVYLGSGECLPADEVTFYDEMHELPLVAGSYQLVVHETEGRTGFIIYFQRIGRRLS